MCAQVLRSSLSSNSLNPTAAEFVPRTSQESLPLLAAAKPEAAPEAAPASALAPEAGPEATPAAAVEAEAAEDSSVDPATADAPAPEQEASGDKLGDSGEAERARLLLQLQRELGML